MGIGIKFDGGKLEWSLLPFEGLAYVVKVLMYGKKKYTQVIDGVEISGADNWKLVDNRNHRYWNAAQRHMIEHQMGNLLDEETKLPHLAHAVCCLLFLLWDIAMQSSNGEKNDNVQSG